MHILLTADQHLGIFFEAPLRLYELRQVVAHCLSCGKRRITKVLSACSPLRHHCDGRFSQAKS
jgi:hypothetical protein